MTLFHDTRFVLITLFAATAIAVAAGCSPEDETAGGGGMVQVDPPALAIGTGTGSETATCGARELCERSVFECGVNLSPSECTDWYDIAEDIGDCADIDAYTACNCDCDAATAADTCDAYFSCGELCYLDHC